MKIEKIRKIIEQEIVNSELLNTYFPKGDKRRGEVLAILAEINVKIQGKLL